MEGHSLRPPILLCQALACTRFGKCHSLPDASQVCQVQTGVQTGTTWTTQRRVEQRGRKGAPLLFGYKKILKSEQTESGPSCCPPGGTHRSFQNSVYALRAWGHLVLMGSPNPIFRPVTSSKHTGTHTCHSALSGMGSTSPLDTKTLGYSNPLLKMME